MTYNFDEKVPLSGTGSIKWDEFKDPEIIGMGTADLDFAIAPNISEALIETAKQPSFNYKYRSDAFFNSIIQRYERVFNTKVEKEWILTTPGALGGVYMVTTAFCNLGDKIIIQTPHFAPFNRTASGNGCTLVLNELLYEDGQFKVDIEDFEKKVKEEKPKMFYLINPQNPTGHVYTKEELTQLAKICLDNNVLIVSDEVHENVIYDGLVHHPIFTIPEAKNNCILVNAPSKGYNLMGLTFNFYIIPDENVRNTFAQTQGDYDFNYASNIFSINGTTAAYSKETDEWLKELNAYLLENRDYLIKYLEENIPRIKAFKPEAGYMIWLDCRDLGMDPQQLKDWFIKTVKVTMSWGERFGPTCAGFERMNFGCTKETLKIALDRIRDAVNAL